MTISGDMDGDGKADITISGNSSNRIFDVIDTGTEATLQSLTLTHGAEITDGGGAVRGGAGTTLSIADTTISNSIARVGGGISAYGSLDLTNVTVAGNIAGYGAGGVFFYGFTGAAQVVNSTISGNAAYVAGGGLVVGDGSSLALVNSTVTNNASYFGGGLATFSTYTTLTVQNSVVSNNIGGDVYGAVTNSDHSFFGDTVTIFTDLGGTNNGGGDAGLGALQDNGGTVATHSIGISSPLINAGSNALLPPGLTEDANGNPRIERGTVDIGATEYQNQGADITTTFLSLDENATVAGTVQANDPEGDGFTFSITGGADGGLFEIDADTGALTFKTAPDVERPGDAGADNVYEVEVTTTDDFGKTDVQTISVIVKDVAEGIVVTTELDVVDANDGLISLREAVQMANKGAAEEAITFDAGLAGKTIVLNGSQIQLLTDLTIDGDVNGDGKADITISGDGKSRIFEVAAVLTDVELHSLTLTNGNAAGSAGGAVLAQSMTSLLIADTTILGSGAAYGGGIQSAGLLTIENSLLTGNSATVSGGGVFIDVSAAATFVNTTIDGNSAGSTGGGVGTDPNAILTLSSSTVTNNSAGTSGGGIYFNDSSLGTITNSVIALNSGGSDATIGQTGLGTSVITANNSFFGTAVVFHAGDANINGGGDPLLGALQDNGGTVETRNILDSSSPLYNAGRNASVPAEDANGNPRIDRGTVDIGATEYQNQGADITTTTLSLDENATDAGTVQAIDPEGDGFTFAITGGADGSLFEIDADTGALTFKDAPDVERPGDAGAENVYEVEVTTTDDFGKTDVQTVSVTVNDVSEGIVVTTELDVSDANDGLISLREAVTMANRGAAEETITFDAALAGKTIVLTGGELALINDVIIYGDVNGDDKADITMSGNDASRVFNMTGTETDVDLLSLTLTNGLGSYGGAVGAHYIASLNISDSTISNSTASIGGGVGVLGTDLTITNSLIIGNSSTGDGGGLNVEAQSTLTVTNSIIHGNRTLPMVAASPAVMPP